MTDIAYRMTHDGSCVTHVTCESIAAIGILLPFHSDGDARQVCMLPATTAGSMHTMLGSGLTALNISLGNNIS